MRGRWVLVGGVKHMKERELWRRQKMEEDQNLGTARRDSVEEAVLLRGAVQNLFRTLGRFGGRTARHPSSISMKELF